MQQYFECQHQHGSDWSSFISIKARYHVSFVNNLERSGDFLISKGSTLILRPLYFPDHGESYSRSDSPWYVTDHKDGHNVEDNPGQVQLPVSTPPTSAVKRKSENYFFKFRPSWSVLLGRHLLLIWLKVLKMIMLREVRTTMGPSSVVMRGWML